MFNVLQSRGVPSRFLSFPDENHVSNTNTIIVLLSHRAVFD